MTIRVVYRWRITPGDEEAFERHWEERTLQLRAAAKGALGSELLRSVDDPMIFVGLARWETRADWEAAMTGVTPVSDRDVVTVELLSAEVLEELRDLLR